MADSPSFPRAMSPRGFVIEARGVSAGYGVRTIVSNIDLELRGGDILGLLGGNGSGKSTLLKALSGQIPLISGKVAIDGVDVTRNPQGAKATLGFAVDAADLPSMLTGRQYIELVASLRGLPVDDAVRSDLVDRLRLGPWLDTCVQACSFGARAKLSIMAALLAAPPLVILDESLNGLDPLAAWELKSLIGEWASTGRHAFVVSTHIAETVPALCNAALFLAEGRIVQHWTRGALQRAARFPGHFEAAVIQALRRPEVATPSFSR